MRMGILLVIGAVLVAALVAGCSKPAQEAASLPSVTGPAAPENTAAPAGDTAASSDGDVKLKCPVMGTVMAKRDMIPVEIPGKTVYVCCSGCIDELKNNPEKYAKLVQEPVKE